MEDFLANLFAGALESVRRDLAETQAAREALVGVTGGLAVRTRARLDADTTRLAVALACVDQAAGKLWASRKAAASHRTLERNRLEAF